MYSIRTFCCSQSNERSLVATVYRGGDVAPLVRASDRQAADAGSIPWCCMGFFSQSQLSVQTLLHVSVHPPCENACVNICAHVKDTVVHVRIWWIVETLKTSSMHSRLGSATLLQLAFPGESNVQPEFPMEEIPLGPYSCKK